MAHEFYRDGDNYVFATGECPAGFTGMLFVVWAGEIDTLAEAAYPKDQIEALESVEIDDVPDVWLDAFEVASGIDIERPLKSAPNVSVFEGDVAPTEAERYDEFAMHCAAGTDVETAMMVSGFGLDVDEVRDEPDPNQGLRKLGPLFPSRRESQREPMTFWQVLASFVLVIIFVLCMMAVK